MDTNAYPADVPQRVDVHAQNQVIELTPRLWKQHFEHQRFRSFVELGDRTAFAEARDQ